MVVTVLMLTCFVKILIKINCISKTIFSLNLCSTVSFTPDPSPLTTLSGTSVAISHNKESIPTYNHRSLSLMHFRCAKCLIHFFFEVVPISSIHPLILSSLPSWPSTIVCIVLIALCSVPFSLLVISLQCFDALLMVGIFLATTLPSFHDIVSLATIQRSICFVPVSTLSSATWPTMGSFTLLHAVVCDF